MESTGEQKYPVMDISHDSKFTGPTTVVKGSNTEVKDIQYPTMINKRKFNTEMSGHGFSEIMMGQDSKVSTELVGPLYDVSTIHAFKGIMTHAHKLSELVGPVFGQGEAEVERKHHFAELGKHAETLKNLTLPVYDVDQKHNYEVIMKEAEKMVNIVGPVYPCDHGNKYQAVAPTHDIAPLMTGPKLTGVQDSNKFCPTTTKVVGDALMTGPVYPGIEAKNQYNQLEEAKPDVPLGMTGPVYSTVAGGNQYTYQPHKVPEHDPQMFTPTMGGGKDSHSYGPVPDRVAGVPQVTGPVLIEKGANQYNQVPVKVEGQR